MRSEKGVKKICLITPGHISTNPRLVKEAKSLIEENYSVHIIFTQYILKLVKEDLIILEQNPSITYDTLNWTGNNLESKIIRLWTGLRQKICTKIYPIITSEKICRIAINRNYNWQIAKAYSANADLYVAHNIGALPIAINASNKNGKIGGFDAEDFHRNETSDNANDPLVKLVMRIENTYIPKAAYLTGASPMIAEAYEKIFNKKAASILNVFPKQKLITKNDNDIIKLFWFSQTIGPGRGIEVIMEAISMLDEQSIELHLLGEIDSIYREKLYDLREKNGRFINKIFIHESISPDAIINFAQRFDVGIASEIDRPLNRDICLTNKIFTYLQSGLAVVASDTKAQSRLLTENRGMGFLYKKHDPTSLCQILLEFLNDRSKLKIAKNRSKNYAENIFNWDIEQRKFVEIINSLALKN